MKIINKEKDDLQKVLSFMIKKKNCWLENKSSTLKLIVSWLKTGNIAYQSLCRKYILKQFKNV